MSKKRKSVSLDSHVHQAAQEDDGDFSPLVNKWAEEYYVEGKRPIMQEQKVEEMLHEIDRREAQLDEAYGAMKDTLSRHRETVRTALADDAEDEQLEEVYNRLTDWKPTALASDSGFENNGVPRNTDNPAIRHAAKQLAISPEQLVDELRKRDRRDGFAPSEESR